MGHLINRFFYIIYKQWGVNSIKVEIEAKLHSN